MQDRRILKPDEASHGFAFFHAREKFQIGAGQQGAEAGKVACEKPRLDNPGLCPGGQQRFGFLLHLHGDDDALSTFGKGDVCNQSEVDAPVLDMRLAGDQAFGGIQRNLDRRAALGQGIPGEPSGDQQGDDRDCPNK